MRQLKCYLYMYKVDYGPHGRYLDDRLKAVKSIRADLERLYGNVLTYDDYLFGT
jgi:hypothetical protein